MKPTDSLKGVEVHREFATEATHAILPRDYLMPISNDSRWNVTPLPDGKQLVTILDEHLAEVLLDMAADAVSDDRIWDSKAGRLVVLMAGPERIQEAAQIVQAFSGGT